MTNHSLPKKKGGNVTSKMPIQRLLSYAVSIGTVIVVGVILYTNREQYQQLLYLRPLPIFAIILLTLLPDRALVNHWLFRALGANVPFTESYGLTVTTTIANQLPFAGGIMAKGLYLKRTYQVTYTTYLSGTAALFVLAIGGAGAIGIAGLSYTALVINKSLAWELLIAFIAMALSPFILLHRSWFVRMPEQLQGLASHLIDGTVLLMHDRKLAAKLAGMSGVGVFLFAIRLWAAFQLLSTSVPFEYCLVFSSATLLTQLVSFAPGGLGIREAIVASLGLLAAVEPTVSVVAVGIERLLSVGISALLAVGFSLTLGRSLTRPPMATEPLE